MAPTRQPPADATIVPARWWEAGHYVAVSLAMARGRDPWADHILNNPWAPASLLEYAYMLDNFVRYDNFLVKMSGKRAGILSLRSRPNYIYIYSLGLMLEYQHSGLGQMLGEFVWDYLGRKGNRLALASVAVVNRPVHVLIRAWGGRLLGLSTTTLTLSGQDAAGTGGGEVRLQRLKRTEAEGGLA